MASKTYDPDADAEAYFYAKLLLHYPWANFDDDAGPEWLVPEDGGSHKRAFARMVGERAAAAAEPQGPEPSADSGRDRDDGEAAEFAVQVLGAADFFMRSVVFPKLNLAEAAIRELRRLNTALVLRSAMQTPGAAVEWEAHRELLRRLRLAAGRPEDELDEDDVSDGDFEAAAGVAPGSSSVFGPVDGGEQALELLFGEGAQRSKQQDIVYWFCEKVRQGNRDPARVLLHGPGGCGYRVGGLSGQHWAPEARESCPGAMALGPGAQRETAGQAPGWRWGGSGRAQPGQAVAQGHAEAGWCGGDASRELL